MAIFLNLSFNCELFDADPKTAEMEKEILPFQMGYLPDFYQKKAEMELKDTIENREKGLKILKEFIENDNHFNGLSFDDDFLLQYLRCRKFNANRAFTQLKAFVNLRKNHTSLFKDFHFDTIAITTRNKIFTFLPYRCQDGCAIILVKLDNWIPEEFPFDDVKRMVTLFLLQSLRDPMTQVNGFKVILDVKSNPIRHIKYATPSNMYLVYHGTQECAPGRFKGFHIINTSITFKAAWSLVKLFLTAKLKRRFTFHDTPEGLLDYFPAAVVPVEYGGELKDYDMTEWLKDVMSPEKLATLGGGKYLDSQL